MPIDDALGELEEVPEHVFKEPLEIPLIIPETIEELAEMYKDKFEIISRFNNYITITHKEKKYSDIVSQGEYNLGYVIKIESNNLIECNTNIYLFDSDSDIVQRVSRNVKDGQINYKHRHLNEGFGTVLSTGKKRVLEDWFLKTDKFILESIPELKEFIKKYANR
jgi:hypothetical protein